MVIATTSASSSTTSSGRRGKQEEGKRGSLSVSLSLSLARSSKVKPVLLETNGTAATGAPQGQRGHGDPAAAGGSHRDDGQGLGSYCSWMEGSWCRAAMHSPIPSVHRFCSKRRGSQLVPTTCALQRSFKRSNNKAGGRLQRGDGRAEKSELSTMLRCGSFMKKTAIGLGLGQFVSLLITSTGFSSSELSRRGMDATMSQSFVNYALLAIVVGCIMICRRRCLQMKWYYYLMLGLVDVEANFLVVKAYQYTSLTGVMLLDCWAIPCVVFLTWIFLNTKYSWRQFVGTTMCWRTCCCYFL